MVLRFYRQVRELSKSRHWYNTVLLNKLPISPIMNFEQSKGQTSLLQYHIKRSRFIELFLQFLAQSMQLLEMGVIEAIGASFCESAPEVYDRCCYFQDEAK